MRCRIDVDDLARQNWDREQVHTVFDGLEFRVLRDRLFATIETPEQEAEAGFEVEGLTLEPAEVPGWLDEHADAGSPVGVHVVGSWARGTGDVSALAIATAAGPAAYLDVTQLDEKGDQAVADWLADSRRPKVLHDAKGPLQALAARGWDLQGIATDTALAAYLVRPDQRSYDLADLVLRNLGRELRAEDDAAGQAMLDFSADGDAEARDAMVRARAVLDLAGALGEQLEATGARSCSARWSSRSCTSSPAWSAPASPPTSSR